MLLPDWIAARAELADVAIIKPEELDENPGTFTIPDLKFPTGQTGDHWAAEVLVAAVIDMRGRVVFSETQRVSANLTRWGPQGQRTISANEVETRLRAFVAEALEAMATMRFYPGTSAGERVTSVICQPFRFNHDHR